MKGLSCLCNVSFKGYARFVKAYVRFVKDGKKERPSPSGWPNF